MSSIFWTSGVIIIFIEMKKIAIIGTGVVGTEILNVLEKLDFPVGKLELFASARSAGKVLETPFGERKIAEFSPEKVVNFDVVFSCVGGGFPGKFLRELSKKNGVVIDNSSHFRLQKNVPLVVPEVNPGAVRGAKLIANPNCTTAILAVALFPIFREFGLEKVIVSTYQATSGGGRAAMDELENETRNFLAGEAVSCSNFAHPIPFNLIPAIDRFLPDENWYTREEMKVSWETRKIFGTPDLKISCTAVRIPTFRAHAESVTIETSRAVDAGRVREILEGSPGVRVVDDPKNQIYPMPSAASENFLVEVGRIRRNLVFGERGLDFFVCGDQLLKGAALNAVQIAKAFLRN